MTAAERVALWSQGPQAPPGAPRGAQGPQEAGRKLVVGANPISVGANPISVVANPIWEGADPILEAANPKIKND